MKPYFSSTDHQTWTLLFRKQSKLRENQIIPEFTKGLELLGINEKEIPDLDLVNQKLKKLTGWSGEYVQGFVEAPQFFKMLSEKKFPIGRFIRDSKDLSYTPAPDVFHDLYGHLPFYTIPAYADFCRDFGCYALTQLSSIKKIEELQRFFWFTIEFGLIKTKNGPRIFGAGIASSFSECTYALSEKPQVLHFDLMKICNQDFRIDLIQDKLFILEDSNQLYTCLENLKKFQETKMENQLKLDHFFDNMWKDYCSLNPQAQKVFTTLTNAGEKVMNDHIAFRTFSHPGLTIDLLAEHFLKYGYVLVGNYKFKEKKLNAKHYEHPDSNRPKVFISELDLNQTSPFLKQVIQNIVSEIDLSKMNSEEFMYSGRPWSASYETYKRIALESEYAAWVYAHGFRPNHFTVYINHLTELNDIKKLNAFLKENGFPLNTSGSEIKGSEMELLEQSSTMANEISVSFNEGHFNIPACYYEFAKRYKKADGQLFQGFIAGSADKIFESTDHQTKI
jgi:monomeric phenylalanine-4-hydroxylase